MTAVAETPSHEIETLARRALGRYDCSPRATLTLVRDATTVLFRVDDPATGETFALRVHRAGIHDRQQIKSELGWLDALRAHRCVEVPPPVSAIDGDRVVELEGDDGPRLVSMNGWLGGEALALADDPVATFRQLGVAAAKLHAHALGWRLPDGFCRPSWGPAEILGAGRDRAARPRDESLGAEAAALLHAAEARVAASLAELATHGPDWTLLHAGLRPEAVLVERREGGQVTRVVDFDDCGRGWLGYDAAVSTSTLEHDPGLPDFLAAWADGYGEVRPLSTEQRALLPTFVMLRRLMLAGWFAGGDGGPPVRTDPAVADWPTETCEVAERYLGGRLGT